MFSDSNFEDILEQEQYDLLTEKQLHLLQQAYRNEPSLFIHTGGATWSRDHNIGLFHSEIEVETSSKRDVKQISRDLEVLSPETRLRLLAGIVHQFAELEQKLRYILEHKKLLQVALALVKRSAGDDKGKVARALVKSSFASENLGHATKTLQRTIYTGERWLQIIEYAETHHRELKRSSLGLVYALDTAQNELEGCKNEALFEKLNGHLHQGVVLVANNAWKRANASLAGTFHYLPERRLCTSANKDTALSAVQEGVAMNTLNPVLAQQPDSSPILNQAYPNFRKTLSENSLASLFTLLCCLAGTEIPTHLLRSGSHPSYSWAKNGMPEYSGPSISPELKQSLDVNLIDALRQLERQHLIHYNAINDSCTVDRSARAQQLESLEHAPRRLWKLEALGLVFSAIPLNNFNDGNPHLDKPTLEQHIRHTLDEVRGDVGYRQLPSELKHVVLNGLLESSFYPGKKWKDWAISEAERLLQCTPDPDGYFRISLKHRRSRSDRRLAYGDPPNLEPFEPQLLGPANHRDNALAGRSAQQIALYYFQAERLSEAVATLEKWKPWSRPSLMEIVVWCEISILGAKILRFQGKFKESEERLQQVQHAIKDKTLPCWGEISGNHALQMADTMLCLANYASARQYADLALKIRHYSLDSRAIANIVLAECFISDKAALKTHLPEADRLLSRIREDCATAIPVKQTYSITGANVFDQSNDKLHGLSKETALRYYISMAKLAYLQDQWEQAAQQWANALKVVNSIPPTSGHVTGIILLSQQKPLAKLGQYDLLSKNKRNFGLLEQVSAKSEALHWIPGLDAWKEYLASELQRSTCSIA